MGETAEPIVGVSLVDWLATRTDMPESLIRREIVMGRCKINGQVVDDPSVRLVNNSNTPSQIELVNDTFLFTKE